MEPGLYPPDEPRWTASRGEKATYAAFKKWLPKGWYIFHSFRYHTGRGSDAEVDFLIVVPKLGILLLEVKSGQMLLKGGHWYQNGEHCSPLDQVLRCKRTVMELLRQKGITNAELPTVEIALMFADMEFDEAPAIDGLEGRVLGAIDLAHFSDALPALIDRHFSTPAPASLKVVRTIHRLWGVSWCAPLSLGTRARRREEELVQLDAEQLKIIDGLEDNDRVLVRGGPGTGKTLLAREVIQRLAADGRRPLYLCFTDALAAGMRSAGVKDAFTVRDLATKVVADEGETMQGGAPSSAWTSATWDSSVSLAACADSPRLAAYDAVVVDEGQDFDAGDWDLVRAIAREGPLWAFADPGQQFWRERQLPPKLFTTRFTLTTAYRCPEDLERFANAYRPPAEKQKKAARVEERAERHDARGARPGIALIRVAKEADIPGAIAKQIRVARVDKAKPEDIAVLSVAGRAKTALCAGGKIDEIDVVPADDKKARSNVVADTFLRFKGLERPYVLVSELARGRDRYYDVRMHIALTRATVKCFVVATEDEIKKDERLAAIAAAGDSTT